MTPTDDAQLPATEPAAPARPRRLWVFALVGVLVLALDVISKLIVVAKLPEPKVERLLGGVIYLDQERNSGAAFSLGTSFTVILSVIAVVVVIVILRFAGRMRSTGWAIALGLILGGALGNLSDRIFRAPGVFRGHVVDWISPFAPYGRDYAVFNLADSAIVCGAILAALLSVLGIDLSGSRSRRG